MSKQTVTIADQVLWQRTGDAMVLLDSASGNYFELNDSAQTIFSALVDSGNVDTAVTELTRQFEIDGAQARSDVQSLLEALAEAGLITLT